MVDLRIKNGMVITMDKGNSVVASDVYVDKGRIAAVGGPEQPARQEIDARGMVVMPGMCDIHDHLRDLAPGLSAGEGLKLDDMLRFHWRLNETAGTAEYRVMAAFSTARLLKAGITTVVDHIYPFHRPGLAEAAVKGYSQTGIRWFMARGIMTKGYDPICETKENALAAIRELAGGLIPKDRLFAAPVSFRQATPDVYEACCRLANEIGIGLYTHIAETVAEVDSIQKEYGARPVEFLHKLGFGSKKSIFVHCVMLSEQEIHMLAESGTSVVHCPTNHMKLAKGFTPVPKLLEAGVNVALGIDTMADLFREVRLETLLQSIHNSNPAIVPPTTALRMATMHGAKAVSMGDELGSLEPGKKADLICVDMSGIHDQPILDPIWSIVYRAEGSDVAHVVVDGEVVVRNHRLTKVDEEALVQETQGIVRSYLNRAGLEKQPVWQ